MAWKFFCVEQIDGTSDFEINIVPYGMQRIKPTQQIGTYINC